MKKVALLTLISTVALASCNMNRTPDAPTGQIAYGLSSDGKLVTFGMGNPDASYVKKDITGLGTDTLVDLDVRNTDGKLYGVASSGKVFMISTENGAATVDSTIANATVVAADFNPAANRLRVAGTNAKNFRHTLVATPVPATTGTTDDGAFVNPDGTSNVNLVAAAYTNSFDNSSTGAIATGTPTTLYTIDGSADTLIMNTVGPQFNTLVTVGKLNVNVMAGMTGFDIAGANSAYLSSVSGNDTNLYTVNLTTGATTALSVKLSGIKLKSIALKLAAQ
ncbi:DUF4394 domain-containing protein [Deinococcus sp. 14RED07]|uniref:DUF4394 domain-containing protein n=1 Tax=Deinococcus sp. 14RED07 TaxID=2745874 RepID=UPI001E3FC4F9|nr:DUF4394 domain-containing protein [Deinococcus sp. 14RED07]MCD0175603.1 DUF4394 domain-containing protein [Deinococcus sp. 14RED07]